MSGVIEYEDCILLVCVNFPVVCAILDVLKEEYHMVKRG